MLEEATLLLTDVVGEAADPLVGERDDYDPLLKMIGDSPVVLIGEASHGTHEFYRERAQITKRLIEEEGFSAVAVEADWPDAYRVNRYVRGISDDADAIEALKGFSLLRLIASEICNRSLAIINNNDRSHRRHVMKRFRRKHWNPDAAVAGGIRQNRRTTVDSDTVDDIIRVIERAERTDPQAVNLSRDDEAAARCVRALGDAAIAVELLVTSAN